LELSKISNFELSLADCYARYGTTVLRRARALMGNPAEASEVLQDVFLTLHERPEQFRGQSSILTYLYSVTTHCCLTRLRNEANRRRLRAEHVPDPEDNADIPRVSPETAVLARRILAQLPESVAQVAVYMAVDGMTQDEIAETMGCSRRRVRELIDQLKEYSQAEVSS
jgi:RNA polymerase sigma factor (sigma-70 family)